ncbi:MAG: LacI family transcriptional regulator [Lentisphaerae bacterium]|nr:LacI family transcriptional regulator [Lentisphaerota bacterium]
MQANNQSQRKKITGADVAKAAGCSQSSVSKVMNNHPNVSEFLRRNVLEQARRLNYDLRYGKLQRLAIILPAPWRFRLDGYVASLLNAMIYVLHRRGIRMEIVQEDDLDVLLSRVIDGGISISWEPELTAKWFDNFQLPLVRINANPTLYRRDNLLAHVNMDGKKSMRNLLDKFYSLGHRRIFLLAPDPMEIEQWRTRYQGFYEYLKSRHIQNPERNCIFNMRENSFEQNLSLLKQAVSSGATALVAVDEGAARNALSLIERLKLNVPKRISVVSWEQKDILPYCDPPITGMAMDYTQLSEAAVDLLAAFCRGEKVSDIYFPFRLIERESVAPVYRKKTKGKLTERILALLANGPETRVRIASALEVKPYCGYFNRTITDLLNAELIVYKQKEGSGRTRLLALPEK